MNSPTFALSLFSHCLCLLLLILCDFPKPKPLPLCSLYSSPTSLLNRPHVPQPQGLSSARPTPRHPQGSPPHLPQISAQMSTSQCNFLRPPHLIKLHLFPVLPNLLFFLSHLTHTTFYLLVLVVSPPLISKLHVSRDFYSFVWFTTVSPVPIIVFNTQRCSVNNCSTQAMQGPSQHQHLPPVIQSPAARGHHAGCLDWVLVYHLY